MPFNLGNYLRPDRAQPRKTRLLRAIVSLSIANLCCLRIWDLLLYNPHRNYLANPPYNSTDYLAATSSVLLLALFVYPVVTVTWHDRNRWRRGFAMMATFGLFLLPLDFIRRSAVFTFGFLADLDREVTILAAAAALSLMAAYYRQKFYSAAFWFFALLSPYTLVNLGHSLRHLISPDYIHVARHLATQTPVQEGVSKSRVVWVIFDEWDQTTLFEERPAELKLPVLDQLIKESVVASQAYPPAGSTRASIPAMLTGRLVTDARITTDARLELQFAGEIERVNFDDNSNVVTDALQVGKRVAVLGWYHAYDRILPGSRRLTAGSWGYPAFQGIRGEGILRSVGNQYGYITLPILGRILMRDIFVDFHAHALRAVADPTLDFIFLHYNVPHLPGIYNQNTNEYKITLTSGLPAYLGNLALVDRTIGEVLGILNRPGMRETTTLIVTSDHWWRAAPGARSVHGYRVPLIVRAKGQGETVSLETPVCTIVLRELIAEFLQGRIRNNAEAAAKLSQAPIVGPIRYENGFLVPGRRP